LKSKLQRIESDISADEKVCVDLQARLRLITPANRKITMEEEQSRRTKLDHAESVRNEAIKESDEILSKLLNQEAFFYRKELLDFITSGRYAIEPRQIAKALAGLPYMTCRHSAERCEPLSSSIPVSSNYEVFSFIRSCWERRGNRGPAQPLVDWFRQEVIRLPKWFRREEQKCENPLRVRLAKDWYFLKRAVEDVLSFKQGQVPKHYFIAQRFLKESLNPANPADRILAAREII
jgi:hypothetical protein